jgi:hypothetical protein
MFKPRITLHKEYDITVTSFIEAVVPRGRIQGKRSPAGIHLRFTVYQIEKRRSGFRVTLPSLNYPNGRATGHQD